MKIGIFLHIEEVFNIKNNENFQYPLQRPLIFMIFYSYCIIFKSKNLNNVN